MTSRKDWMTTKKRLVTLERQMTPGTDWNRGTRGSIPKCSSYERTPKNKLHTPTTKDTLRVYREGGRMITHMDGSNGIDTDRSNDYECSTRNSNLLMQQGLQEPTRSANPPSKVRLPTCEATCTALSRFETQKYPSLDSNHSIEELSVYETTHDGFQDSEVEKKDPLLDLLKSS